MVDYQLTAVQSVYMGKNRKIKKYVSKPYITLQLSNDFEHRIDWLVLSI